MFDEDLLLAAAVHADLLDVEVWRLVRGEEDVVMSGVLVALELGGRDVTAEVVITAGGEVAGAEDFFILDVGTGYGEDLRTKAELAEHTGHWVIG